MSAELATTANINADEARRLTDRIKVAVEATWQLVIEAYEGRAWAALGYSSWDDYCTREFGASRIRLPREERAEVVASLRDAGLSTRAIAAATGINRETVMKDLQVAGNQPPVANATPALADDDDLIDAELADLVDGMDEIVARPRPATPAAEPEPARTTGIDGKSYSRSATPAAKQRRPSLVDAARNAGWEFRKAVERMERIVTDDRFPANREQVAAQLNDHLLYALEDKFWSRVDQSTDGCWEWQGAVDNLAGSHWEELGAVGACVERNR